MNKTFVYPYHAASVSSKLIAKELDIKRLKRERSKVADGANVTIINWGAGSIPFVKARIINKPAKVSRAANKLHFLRDMAKHENISIPAFTTDYKQAAAWITEGHHVCSRAVLNGSGGKGLVITNELDKLPKGSPLYTRYVFKSKEFRVHVVNGAVIRVQAKVWPNGKEAPEGGVDFKIRNHEHGFIFQTIAPGEVPIPVTSQAVLATAAAGLDFAGCDVVWSSKFKKATVLEINCAPGIEGETVTHYGDAFRNMLRKFDQ